MAQMARLIYFLPDSIDGLECVINGHTQGHHTLISTKWPSKNNSNQDNGTWPLFLPLMLHDRPGTG